MSWYGQSRFPSRCCRHACAERLSSAKSAQESVDELIKGDEHLLHIAPHYFVEKSAGWKAMTIFSSSSFVFAFSIASRNFHFS